MGQFFSMDAGAKEGGDVMDECRDLYLELKESACEFAWKQFAEDAQPQYIKLEATEKGRDSVEVFIDWSRVNIKNTSEWEDSDDAISTSKELLYETVLENHTGETMTQLVRAQRCTKSTCEIKVESKVAVGIQAGVKLGFPPAITISAGFKLDAHSQLSRGSSVSTEVTWNVETNVKIPSHNEATVKVFVVETKRKLNFKVLTDISGDVFISFRKGSKRIFLCSTSVGKIVKFYEDNFLADSKFKMDTRLIEYSKGKSAVNMTTTGTSEFTYGSKQQVDVRTKSIDEEESSVTSLENGTQR